MPHTKSRGWHKGALHRERVGTIPQKKSLPTKKGKGIKTPSPAVILERANFMYVLRIPSNKLRLFCQGSKKFTPSQQIVECVPPWEEETNPMMVEEPSAPISQGGLGGPVLESTDFLVPIVEVNEETTVVKVADEVPQDPGLKVQVLIEVKSRSEEFAQVANKGEE